MTFPVIRLQKLYSQKAYFSITLLYFSISHRLLLPLFIKHTSAALSINENADPDVRTDMESIFNHLIKEREPYYEHTLEGWDDMPAHAKATIIGVSLTIPITEGRLNMGIWQGIYLCEFRNHGGGRKIVATVMGE